MSRAYRAWRLGLDKKESTLLDKEGIHLPLAAMVELAAFREWKSEQEGRPIADRPNARDLIRATGLDGLREQLDILGMFPAGQA